MNIHVFTHYAHKHNTLEHNNGILLAFRQYFCIISEIIMWAMNRMRRKGDGTHCLPVRLLGGAEPDCRRGGREGRRPSPPSVSGGGHERSGNRGLRDLRAFGDFGLKRRTTRSRENPMSH
jgi:hypothetical protein